MQHTQKVSLRLRPIRFFRAFFMFRSLDFLFDSGPGGRGRRVKLLTCSRKIWRKSSSIDSRTPWGLSATEISYLGQSRSAASAVPSSSVTDLAVRMSLLFATRTSGISTGLCWYRVSLRRQTVQKEFRSVTEYIMTNPSPDLMWFSKSAEEAYKQQHKTR